MYVPTRTNGLSLSRQTIGLCGAQVEIKEGTTYGIYGPSEGHDTSQADHWKYGYMMERYIMYSH